MDSTPSAVSAGPMLSLPSWLLTQTAIHAHRLVADGLAEINARGHHYRVLIALRDHGPASQAEIGRRTGIHLSDLVAALNELALGGFVNRTPDPDDGRRNIVVMTPAGRRRLGRLEKRLAEVQAELLFPLAAAERDQLTRLLGRVLAHHEEREVPPG